MRRTLAAVAVISWSAPARAYDFEVTAATIGQGDQLRRFQDGEVVLLSRRRITQLLGLRVFDLLPPPDPDSGKPVPRLQIVSSLRFDSDFGGYVDNRDPAGLVVVPEVEDDQLDVLLLYAEGRDLARATTDVRLGRQVTVDPLDYYAFDGADVLFHPPLGCAIEGFGGLQVRGADPLSSPVLELDGTTDTVLAPEEPDALSPMFGGAVQTYGLRSLFARASYRRTSSTADVAAVGESGPREVRLGGVDEEKVALTARARVGEAIFPYAGARYDALTARLDLAEAGARVPLGARHALTPAWALAVPTFEGDSIWNLYSTEPWQDGSLTYDVVPLARLGGTLRYLVRRYANAIEDDARSGAAWHHGAGAGARVRFARGFARLDGRFETGYGGRTAGADLSGRWDAREGVLALDGRVTALRYEDELRADALRRELWSVGVAAGARWSLADGVALHFLAEENSNQLYASYLRLLAMLDLAYAPDVR